MIYWNATMEQLSEELLMFEQKVVKEEEIITQDWEESSNHHNSSNIGSRKVQPMSMDKQCQKV